MTCQNLILPKKQGSKFYKCNFSALRAALIVGQNPFRQRENLRNAGETHLVPTGEIDQKIDPSVTTSHLLLQDPPGETVALLPIWQPNSEFLKAKCSERAKGGGGSQPGEAAEGARSKSSHGILSLLVPLPVLVALKKKSRFKPRPNSKRCALGLSRELTFNPQ